MDHYSILDKAPSPAVEVEVAGQSANRAGQPGVSAGIAAANAAPPPVPVPVRFPGDDGGRSLNEMAQRDLDAALQLLAERAQYITGASGAAIALRRRNHNDMLCRANVGSNAPELGALLSTEHGLSGESVRTRQALRCDDTERDARVNRDGCRQLGIASVVVMPILGETEVLGVFELFSGKPRAFEQRDIAALERLAEMVETAVKHTEVVHIEVLEEETPGATELTVEVIDPEAAQLEARAETLAAKAETAIGEAAPAATEPEKETAAFKPKFWSASMQAQSAAKPSPAMPESIAVPPGLRTLQKCRACGFPVTQGRTYCVECEEKKWKGRLPRPGARTDLAREVAATPNLRVQSVLHPAAAAHFGAAGGAAAAAAPAQVAVTTPAAVAGVTQCAKSSMPPPVPTPETAGSDAAAMPSSEGEVSAPLFAAAAPPAESWLAAHKYTLGAFVVVAIVVAVLVWLR